MRRASAGSSTLPCLSSLGEHAANVGEEVLGVDELTAQKFGIDGDPSQRGADRPAPPDGKNPGNDQSDRTSHEDHAGDIAVSRQEEHSRDEKRNPEGGGWSYTHGTRDALPTGIAQRKWHRHDGLTTVELVVLP